MSTRAVELKKIKNVEQADVTAQPGRDCYSWHCTFGFDEVTHSLPPSTSPWPQIGTSLNDCAKRSEVIREQRCYGLSRRRHGSYKDILASSFFLVGFKRNKKCCLPKQ